jgi:hypothetical protein
VTKGEFQTFATEVLKKMEELQSSTTKALQPNTEALQAFTTASNSLASELKTVKSSAITKEDLTKALSSFTPTADTLQTFKDDVIDAGKSLVVDLVSAGYSNYSKLNEEIKKMVESAMIIGQSSSSSQANINHLATRREIDAMVEALANIVRKQNENITRDFRASHRITASHIRQMTDNIIAEGVRFRGSLRNYTKDIRFNSNLNINAALLSVEELIQRLENTVQGLLDGILSISPTTGSAEADPVHGHQGGNDPDDHEGEKKKALIIQSSQPKPAVTKPT